MGFDCGEACLQAGFLHVPCDVFLWQVLSVMERGGGQLEVSLDTLAQHMASADNFHVALLYIIQVFCSKHHLWGKCPMIEPYMVVLSCRGFRNVIDVFASDFWDRLGVSGKRDWIRFDSF